jgi:hypothetical protein
MTDKMKNKLAYIIPAATIAIVLFVYFGTDGSFLKGQSPVQSENTENEEGLPENNGTESRPELSSESQEVVSGADQPTAQKETGSNIVTDDFQITPPPGWEGRPAPEGVLAIAINPSEIMTDQEAVKIGFKSYFAVNNDDLQGKTREEYIRFMEEEIGKISSSMNFDTVWTTKANGKDATVLDISINRQNVDFKISLFLVWNGEDVWVISFNTTEDKWEEYKDVFFTSGTSFKLK